MKTLTLVVTYNEAANIGKLVPAILAALPGTDVLVVDDNSPDGTSRVVAEFAQHDPRVQSICRTNERGYGSAMIAGLTHGIAHGYEAILTLDADFSHDPNDLPRLLEALDGAEVAVGSRYCGGVRVLNWDVRRLLLSLAANAYVRKLSGLACIDCTSGFRAYRTRVFKRINLSRIRTTGYAFLPELLFSLHLDHVAEVPICYTERREGESKMSGRVITEAIMRPWGLFLKRLVGRG
ncbi:MAG: polyprenol monophosphomannose synthase [Vicinamibacterales bacterium]